MSMKYIRDTYGVPAKRGGRVIYHGSVISRTGTITGSRDARILVRMDGNRHSSPYHPTWKMEYL